METGSNKSLFTLIAVVIFGIFLSLSYWLFKDEMKNVLANVLDKTSESVNNKLEISLDALGFEFKGDSFDNETKQLTNIAGFDSLVAYNFAGTALSGNNGIGGLNFDGVDDYLETNLEETSEITLHFDFRMKFASKGTQSLLGSEIWIPGIIHVNISNNTRLNWGLNGVNPVLNVYDVFEDGERYVVDLVYSSDYKYARTYINGILVNEQLYTDTVTLPLIDQTVKIGTNFTNDRYFGGTMYNVSYYNRALSDAEVLQLYSNSLTD